MERLDVKKDDKFCYSIRFEKDFSCIAEELITLGFSGHKLCIVTDSNVGPLYLEKLKLQSCYNIAEYQQ